MYYFLILALFFSLVVPLFVDLDYVVELFPTISHVFSLIDSSQVYLPVGSTIYFLVGYLLDRVANRISKRKAIVLLIVAFFLFEALSIIDVYRPEAKSIITVLRYGRYYGSYVSLAIMFYAVSVFLFLELY